MEEDLPAVRTIRATIRDLQSIADELGARLTRSQRGAIAHSVELLREQVEKERAQAVEILDRARRSPIIVIPETPELEGSTMARSSKLGGRDSNPQPTD